MVQTFHIATNKTTKKAFQLDHKTDGFDGFVYFPMFSYNSNHAKQCNGLALTGWKENSSRSVLLSLLQLQVH